MAQAYKVDFTTRTITITAEFEKAMSNPEAAEYKIIRQLCADFPGMRIVKRTHRTPTHYTSKNGEKSACNPYKNLTYEKMERFMDALPNGAEYRKQYDFLKSPAAAIQTNGYSTVREWFIAQFPLYRKNPLFYLTETPKIISGVDFAKQQTDAAKNLRYFHIGMLCYVFSEYLLWTAGCFWPNISPASPTSLCDMLLTVAILGLLPATRRAVRP